ncbi:MAG: hypothetical protein IT435_10325 [Phycisphaerales bacterium]|nr:hypothetical protein [Phycisphaerales bacterium]
MPARPTILVSASILAILAGLPMHAGAHAHAPTPISASAGDKMKLAEGFIAMINDGSPDAVTKFESANRSAKMLASVPIPERIGRVAKMKNDFGTLTIDQVISADDSGISLVVKASKGQTIAMDFAFDDADGGKLQAVTLSIGGDEVRPTALTPQARKRVIEGACKALEEGYVFPDVAAKMSAVVMDKLAKGKYDPIKSETVLARQLTEDFRSVSNDRHLGVNISPAPVTPHKSSAEEEDHTGGFMAQMTRQNYGFRKAELLDGNIGYLRFDAFVGSDGAKKVASAAMNFLANSSAIIFDMRHNGGGDPDMIRYITSYLYDTKTHLNDMVDRDGKIVEEFWTLDEVPGDRIPSTVPIYVLTSSHSFSGAEEFTYNLKNLKRATIIGQTTGGGAHPVRGERLSDRFVIGVPFMRAQNPISKTNWEGTGVEPDIKTSVDEALDRAIAEAKKAITAAHK